VTPTGLFAARCQVDVRGSNIPGNLECKPRKHSRHLDWRAHIGLEVFNCRLWRTLALPRPSCGRASSSDAWILSSFCGRISA